MARTGLVIVASTRAAAGEYEDRSGPIAVEFLRSQGFATPAARVVPDALIKETIDELFADPEGCLFNVVQNVFNIISTSCHGRRHK